ncbi:relaxase/mobilization nuclease domain-containing protein [Kordiimonas pumila]|uniref:Relaxase/mobilization nuclease domain-containing protein n=1 Tax=Kordiimonas pumila TaxID=2161677 RepID=A0ABV7D3U1_9PROT|nr:relaxase [Kordiimonas pumila]
MILVGNQRGGAYDLAHHLMKDENEHVDVHELRGFASDDLHGAFQEAHAISKATKCKQFLFSLSLNPPPDVEVPTQDFEAAIERVENKLGLDGQPRAIVFHEKEGADGMMRRHAHAVWSRIDAQELKARQLSFDRNKMQEISRELYLEHGWKMPEGLSKSSQADPRNFTLEEWQQAKRQDKDPRDIKTALQDAWAISDNKAAFTHALEERGYRLARGDRRGFLAVNTDGKHYSLSRWSDVKPKDLKARLGDASKLPGLEETKAVISQDMGDMLDRFDTELAQKEQLRKEALQKEKQALIAKQREQRAEQKRMMEARLQAEAIRRQARFRKGTKGLWDRINGQHKRIRERNEIEAWQATRRDQARRDELIFRHMEQRKRLARNAKQDLVQIRQQQRVIAQDRKVTAQITAEHVPPQQTRRRRSPQKIDATRTISTSFNEAANRDARREAFMKKREMQKSDPARQRRGKNSGPER